MKNIYLIVGPSGSGKTMVANRLEEKYRLKQVLSYTERRPALRARADIPS